MLLEVAAEGDVDDLHAAADGEQRSAGGEGPLRDGEVEGVLLGVDVVDLVVGGARGVAAGVEVAAAGEQHARRRTTRRAPTSSGVTTPPGAHGCTVTGSPPATRTSSESARAVLRARWRWADADDENRAGIATIGVRDIS